MGRVCFFRSGRTLAALKESGKVPSESARFMMLVIGSKRGSRQDFRRKVGMVSREQEALEDFRIAILTSSGVAGAKAESEGGAVGGSTCGEVKGVEEKAEHSLEIF